MEQMHSVLRGQWLALALALAALGCAGDDAAELEAATPDDRVVRSNGSGTFDDDGRVQTTNAVDGDDASVNEGAGGMLAASGAGAAGAGAAGRDATSAAGDRDAGPGVDAEAGSTGDSLFENPEGCPAAYDELASAGCTTAATCIYPEGRCMCISGCSGAQPPPDAQPAPASWVCEALVPGCPPAVPEDGAACGSDSRTCDYGSCCIQRVACLNGRWSVGAVTCPP